MTLRTLTILLTALFLANASTDSALADEQEGPPNVIIIFCDDLGYGDLGCFGHPTIRTPNLDRMAAEGMKFTQFYAGACVCTPSRAALLTGRLPIRSGMCSDRRRVLFPDSQGGIQADEITLAEIFRAAGYATGCVGKWHLGHLPPFLPTNHGFDSYFGIPYSNDMDRSHLPLLRNEEIIEQPVNQSTITQRYTDEAVQFIESNHDQPFFLYFPHTFPHTPLFAGEAHLETSSRGLYGDVVEELDASVGRVLDTLREKDLTENTLVFFTSDNGPWLNRKAHGGSAGLLRGGKGSTWEGGMREPTLAWWPGTIEAGSVSQQVASTMDIFATACAILGQALPDDRLYDSHDLTPVLTSEGPTTREALFYYRGTRLMAVRQGPWKAHYITQAGYGSAAEEHDPPLLFHLEIDPGEQWNVADQHAEVLDQIQEVIETHRADLDPPPSQLD